MEGVGLDTAPRGEEAATSAVASLTAPIPAILGHQRLPEGDVFTRGEHVALGRDPHVLVKNENAVVLAAAVNAIRGGYVVAVIDPVVVSLRSAVRPPATPG